MTRLNSSTPITKGTVKVLKSRATDKLYGVSVSDNSFIGMLASDFDKSKPAFIINVTNEESGESWSFIGNHEDREPIFII